MNVLVMFILGLLVAQFTPLSRFFYNLGARRYRRRYKIDEHNLYRKKPVTIEAWQFTKSNFSNGVPEFIKHAPSKPVTLYSQFAGEIIYGEIETLEGKRRVSENDYIIKGVQGEFYPCKPDIFETTYEKVD